MAGISTGQGGDKLNTELNLVPFIDLLSTLTLFLLITAVWVQISAISAGVKSSGETVTAAPPDREGLLDVHLSGNGYELRLPKALEGRKEISPLIAKATGAFDLAKLRSTLALVARSGKVTTAAVSSEDEVDYGEVVHAIDAVRGGGFPSVALSTN